MKRATVLALVLAGCGDRQVDDSAAPRLLGTFVAFVAGVCVALVAIRIGERPRAAVDPEAPEIDL